MTTLVQGDPCVSWMNRALKPIPASAEIHPPRGPKNQPATATGNTLNARIPIPNMGTSAKARIQYRAVKPSTIPQRVERGRTSKFTRVL